MTIEHKNVADPDVHEPKDISTADAGAVYVADGSGSGDWNLNSYGEMKVSTNTAAFTPSTADITDYKKLVNTGWSAGESQQVTVTANDVDDEMTMSVSGNYKIDFWCSFDTSASTGTEFAVKFAIDGALDPRLIKIQKNSSGADTLTLSASGLASITAGQTLAIYLASAATTTLTIENAGFLAHRLGD